MSSGLFTAPHPLGQAGRVQSGQGMGVADRLASAHALGEGGRVQSGQGMGATGRLYSSAALNDGGRGRLAARLELRAAPGRGRLQSGCGLLARETGRGLIQGRLLLER